MAMIDQPQLTAINDRLARAVSVRKSVVPAIDGEAVQAHANAASSRVDGTELEANPEHDASVNRGDLREKALAGLRWVSIGRLAAELIGMSTMVLLARLVSPAEFGALAISAIIGEFADGFAGEGFGNPLVQRKLITKRHLEVTAFLSICCGSALCVLTLVFASLAAAPLFGRHVAFLFDLSAPFFVLSSISIVPRAMLQRRLNFLILSTIDVATVFLTRTISVGLAIEWHNAQAVVVGGLIGGVICLLIYFRYSPMPFPRWHTKEMREIAAFGVPASIAGFAWTAYRNVDYTILGARLAAAQVGFYWRAFTLGEEYQRKISNIVLQMSFPLMARAEGREHMARLRKRLMQLNAVVIFPFLGMLIAIAPFFVPWLLGPAWRPAVLPAQILAVSGMGTALNTGTGEVVLAAGKPRIGLRFNIAQVLAYALLVYLLAPYGIVTVCFGVVGFRVLFLAASYEVMLRPLIGTGVRELLHDVLPGALGTGALIAVAAPLASALAHSHVPAPLLCAAACAAGSICYIAVIRVGFPSVWRDLMLIAERIFGPRLGRFLPRTLIRRLHGSSA